ncbi:MAG: hypothetical protein NXI15_09035 [Gammaproteobacteria bacterium]|nr:hypothetical protein [Gammaproteobacteria bacterium]
MSSEITNRQTTFWDLNTPEGGARVHFIGKEEFFYQDSQFEILSFHEDHPLLLSYHSPWLNLYISSVVAQPDDLLNEIALAWANDLAGWRSPLDYMTQTGPKRMLLEGYGQFLSAPETLAQLAKVVLLQFGVTFTLLPGQKPRGIKKLMLAGENYVIANDFRVESSAT